MDARGRALLLTLLVAVGCGEPPPPDITVDTTFSDCATGEQLSGGILQQASQGRVGQYALLYENSVYLLVGQDGCVWARSGTVWEPVHARRLTADERQTLETRVGLESWAARAGQYEGDLFDGDPYLFWDGKTAGVTILCLASCIGASVPTDILSFADSYRTERARFAQDEPAYAGHVRFMLIRQEGGTDRREPIRWPIANLRASTVALEPTDPRTQQFGNGMLSSTPKQAALLRWLRSQFLARPELSNGGLDIPVTEDGVRYSLLLRDALPLETADGRVPFP
jgi:hypothetical protein